MKMPPKSVPVSVGRNLANRRRVSVPQQFVYIIKSATNPTRYYTGRTSNVPLRLADHNAGHSRHTASGRPWRVVVVVEFAEERWAIEFEKYLKFSVRHFR